MAGSVPSLLQAHDRPGLQNTKLPSPNTRHGHSHWSAQSRDYCFKIVYIQVCQKETVCPRKTSSKLTHLAGSMHQPSQRSRLDRIRSLWRSCRSHIPSNKFTPKTAEFNHAAQSPRLNRTEFHRGGSHAEVAPSSQCSCRHWQNSSNTTAGSSQARPCTRGHSPKFPTKFVVLVPVFICNMAENNTC